MDLHPTPFPGKRRPSANSIKKDGGRIKPSKQPAPPALAAAQTRPKRAFGIVRSTNIPIEKPASKPQPTKTSKPWKPSVTSVNPSKRDAPAPAIPTATKAPDHASGSDSGKSKADSKKNHHVGFQEPMAVMVAEGIERSGREDGGVHTPVSSIKPAALGTPYLSAQNCSKCRLDRLETSSYWLIQIKLAESVEKHFVSAALFRLALECHAQPFLSLQNELKHYVARHRAISAETLWKDLHEAFGLSDGQSIASPSERNKIHVAVVEQEGFELNDPSEANCKTVKDGSLECDASDNPHKDSAAEDPIEHIGDNSTDESKEVIGIKESVEATASPSFTEDSSLKNKTCSSVGDGKKPFGSNFSGKKLYGEKSKVSFNDSSSKPKTHSSVGSADKGGETLNRTQTGSKISGGKLTRRNGTGSRMSPNSEPRKFEGDAKGMSPYLSENLNSDEIDEDIILNQSA